MTFGNAGHIVPQDGHQRDPVSHYPVSHGHLQSSPLSGLCSCVQFLLSHMYAFKSPRYKWSAIFNLIFSLESCLIFRQCTNDFLSLGCLFLETGFDKSKIKVILLFLTLLSGSTFPLRRCNEELEAHGERLQWFPVEMLHHLGSFPCGQRTLLL